MRRRSHLFVTMAISCVMVMAAVLVPAGAQDGDAPPPLEGQAVSLLAPGNNGTVTVGGQLSGSTGGSYGEDLDE